jgi:hypothetical protein
MPDTLPHAFSHHSTSAFHPFLKDSFSCWSRKNSTLTPIDKHTLSWYHNEWLFIYFGEQSFTS